MSIQEMTVSATGAMKVSKPERYSLIPPLALARVARVFNHGAGKYSPHNWRLGYPDSHPVIRDHIIITVTAANAKPCQYLQDGIFAAADSSEIDDFGNELC